jgi:AAA+ superfamily predicted ATPase
MTATSSPNWHETNQRALMAEIATVRRYLEDKLREREKSEDGERSNEGAITDSPPIPASFTSALDQLCAIFGLSQFEREILLFCVGMELDSQFPWLCATLQGDPQRAYPTFSLALTAFPSAYWHALSPKASLRRWQLIEVGAGKTLTLSPLRADERILHYLVGVQHLDERLSGIVKPANAEKTIVDSHRLIAEHIAQIWAAKLNEATLPIVQLCGNETASKLSIATTACAQLNLNLQILSPATLPTNPNELHALVRLWEREAILSNSALLIHCDELDNSDAARTTALTRFIEEVHCPLIINTQDRRRPQQRPFITIDVHPPTSNEQTHLWRNELKQLAPTLNGHIESLVSQFNLSPLAIQTVCTEAIGHPTPHTPHLTPHTLPSTLWDLCRSQARPQLDDLAQRIESGSSWEDLVLPEAQKQTLREIAAHVRQRAKVYEHWGFAGKSGRGLGISALFAGASGTGKTMAADVLAQELRLDVYRIDLSQVVSKYIGETEKNLRRVFDAAETGGVILLFDEADALFGKRSEVKDSHDRYANMEVSYLLQRMEAYRGLAILTTNLKDALDVAFLRRLRFVVKFPFPDAEQRAEIWRRIFPSQTPVNGLDVKKLARLNVAGGNIRNIALNAAFLAAEAGEAIGMQHLLNAAQSEYTKLERTLTEAEIRGWR